MKKPRPSIDSVYRKHKIPFNNTFGVLLISYWDNDHGGFLMRPFLTQVIGYSGPFPHDEVVKQFGADGRRVIRNIIRDLGATW